MRIETSKNPDFGSDDWLSGRCREVEEAGRELALAVGQVNERTQQATNGELGRRRRITDAQIQRAADACRALREVQAEVQNVLFDCEHELRSLRERDVNPAELLVDGERLVRKYRFLRRRARILDGLLAYLPMVTQHADACLEQLRRIQEGSEAPVVLMVPDCGFALVALEELREGGA